MHLVLIRFSSLGDVVMQTGFVSWLKFLLPNIKITFITSKECSLLLKGHPHIDTLIEYEKEKGLKDLKKLKALGEKINKKEKIDFIIDLHGTTRAFFFKLLNPKIPALNLDKRRIERQLLVKLKVNFLKSKPSLHVRNILDLYGLFTNNFDQNELSEFLINSSKNQEFFGVTSSPLSFEEETFVKPLDKYIVISPVASFTPKRWPMEKFNQLIDRILISSHYKHFGVCVVAGPNDDYVDEVEPLVQKYPGRLKNLKGKTNLAQSSKVIQHSELLIGNDSGMGHIAESFGVPVIAIFGPTSEDFGFRPHLKDSQTSSVDLWCRPCSTTGKTKCFRKKQYCMEQVSITDIMNKLKMVIHNDI